MSEDIAVILTVWKRNNLEKQVQSLIEQDVQPSRVIVYQNENHVNVKNIVEMYGLEHMQSINYNHKFHARFALPLLLEHKYCAIYDDDTISNKGWLKTCLKTIEKHNCIVGCNGRIINSNFQNAGGRCLAAQNINTYNSKNIQTLKEDRLVDFVGHCWFFKSEWTKYMWMTDQCSFETGEDISFSAACKIHGGIQTYVPKMTMRNMDCWGSIEPSLGADEHATYKNQKYSLRWRKAIITYWMDQGWKPLFKQD